MRYECIWGALVGFACSLVRSDSALTRVTLSRPYTLQYILLTFLLLRGTLIQLSIHSLACSLLYINLGLALQCPDTSPSSQGCASPPSAAGSLRPAGRTHADNRHNARTHGHALATCTRSCTQTSMHDGRGPTRYAIATRRDVHVPLSTSHTTYCTRLIHAACDDTPPRTTT